MRKNLFLFLALACFVGLLAIFVFDGYLGIYDTVFITTGERTTTIGPEVWLTLSPRPSPVPVPVPVDGDAGAFFISANREDQIIFRYDIDNRRFFSLDADIAVSVWKSQQKVRDITSQKLSLSSFGKGTVGWVIDNAEVVPSDISTEQSYQYTVVITSGRVERRIVVFLNPVLKPALR